MSDEGKLIVRDSDMPAIADDYLIQIADQAERRIDAVIKIKQVALKVTNARDWTDQQGNPYLQVSGSEKIANLFNISWRIEEPKCEDEPDGHFTYSIKGEFSLGGRTIEVEGTRSSKDGFFNRYDYSKPKGADNKHPVLPPSSIDKGDVKKAALTNLYGNGITRLLGIRNLTWDDLAKFAGITQEMVKGKVSYNQREANETTELKKPLSKSNPTPPPADTGEKKTPKESLIAELSAYVQGDAAKFKAVLKELTAFDQNKGTDNIEKLSDKWAASTLGKLRKRVEDGKGTQTDDTPECTKDPMTCGESMFDEFEQAYCGDDPNKKCQYQVKENA